MSTTIDRLRAKIDGYVERFEANTADTKVIDILRPLIFVHWTGMLKQAPEQNWKAVCIMISRIDQARLGSNDVLVGDVAQETDADQIADLNLFQDSDSDIYDAELNKTDLLSWVGDV
jgi:hypothetical protein